MIERLPTNQLEAMLDDETANAADRARAERELERRDYDASDPWSPENHH
jgi:hypothetical protein